uniref:Uncharacterized protein n=1 Tax=viral metagenome TaxID=1070528 RepID=A0A6M3J7M1_9ZZZZ
MKNTKNTIFSKKAINDKLDKALNSVSYEKHKDRDGLYYFLRHLVQRSYESDMVAVALGKKLVPDKTENEELGDKHRDIFNLINQIQSDVSARGKTPVELDKGNGLDTRRT